MLRLIFKALECYSFLHVFGGVGDVSMEFLIRDEENSWK